MRVATLIALTMVCDLACFTPGEESETDLSGTDGSDPSAGPGSGTSSSASASAGPGSASGSGDPDGTASTSGSSTATTTTDTTDGTDTTDATDTAETSSDSESGATGCSGTCLDIPEGWNGPVEGIDADGDAVTPACEGSFGQSEFVGFEGLTADAAQCDCDCGDAQGAINCPNTSTLTQYDNNVVNCVVQTPGDVAQIVEGCNDIPFYDDAAFRLIVPELNLAGVTCDPEESVVVPAAQWASQVAGCGLAMAPEACDEGSCVPAPSDESSRVCVWSEGDQECPAGDFTQRQVLYQSVQDDRDCSTCGCDDAQGSCSATVTLRAGEGCSAGSPASGPDATCLYIETPARSVDLAYDAPDVVCAPTGGAPTGSASEADAITLCCLD